MHPVAEYRRARGLSQEALARALGVSLNTVQRWEDGAIPRARYLPALAQALGVDPMTLDRTIRAWKSLREGQQDGHRG